MKRALAFGAVAALTACGHTETYEAMFRAAEPPPTHPVELYMADQTLPQRSYYEIALVQAVGYGDEAHPEDVARALSAKAAALGCDAVLRIFIDQGYSRSNANGVCIRWVGPADPNAAPAATTIPTKPSPPPRGPNGQPPPGPVPEYIPSSGPR